MLGLYKGVSITLQSLIMLKVGQIFKWKKYEMALICGEGMKRGTILFVVGFV